MTEIASHFFQLNNYVRQGPFSGEWRKDVTANDGRRVQIEWDMTSFNSRNIFKEDPAIEVPWSLLEDHFRSGKRSGIYRDLGPKVLRAILGGVLLGISKFARAGEYKLTRSLLDRAGESAWSALVQPR